MSCTCVRQHMAVLQAVLSLDGEFTDPSEEVQTSRDVCLLIIILAEHFAL